MSRASANYTIKAKDSTKEAIKSVKSGFKSMDALVLGVTGGLVGLGVAGVAAMASIYQSQSPIIDRLAKTADKLGLTTEALQAMRDAAERAGISNSNLDISVQRMTRRVAEAATGSGEAVKALDQLGLSATELVKLSPDEMFARISDELQNVDNQSKKVALAFKFFDSGGVDLVRLTSDAIAEAGQEMDALGISITRVDASQVEAANDTMQRLERNVSGVASQLAAQLAPAVGVIGGRLLGLTNKAGNVRDSMVAVVDAMVDVVGFFGNLVSGVGTAFDALVIGVEKNVIQLASVLNKVGVVSDTLLANMRFINDEKTRLLADKVNGISYWEQLKLDIQSARTEAIKTAADIAIAQNGTNNDGVKPNNKLFSVPGADATGPVLAYDNLKKQEADALAKQAKRIESEFLKIQDLYRSDTDAILIEFERKKSAIDAYSENGTDEQLLAANEALFNAEREKHAKLYEIERAGWSERQKFTALSARNQAKSVLGELANLTAGVANSNRQMFELNKAAGIGSAIISTYEGISKSLSAYPWPIAGVMAAAHAAAGFAQVDAIRNTSFGSTSVAPSLSGSAGAPVTETSTFDPSNAGQQANEAAERQIIVVNNYGHDFLDNDKVDNATTESLRRATGDDKITWKNGEPIFNVA